jgi:glutamine synthetase
MSDPDKKMTTTRQTPPHNLPEYLELLVPDMNGIPRGKTMEADHYNADELPHVAAAIFFQSLTGHYANAMSVYNRKDEDLLLNPQWSTYRRVPWRTGEYGQVICETLDKSGNHSHLDSRNALIRVLEQYHVDGLEPVVAPEVEFYLIKPIEDPTAPIEPAPGSDNTMEFGNEAFSIDALDRFENFVQELKQACKETKLELSAIVHEMGPSQIEINVEHGDALERADQLFLLKRTVKAVAFRHGMTATFMAKPLPNWPGSGLHIHSSVYRDGTNIFALEDGKAPAELKHFIGGLQRYLPDAFSLVSPNINSYKRFVPGLAAPINLHWGYDNRTTGFRVPYGSGKNGRVENRVVGADANPYLFFAAHLACGLLGMRERIKASDPIETNAFNLPASLPTNLAQALERLQASESLTGMFGKIFVDTFISVKEYEYHRARADITPWERKFLGSLI